LGRELGVMVFATPFSESGVEFLHGLGAPCFKIAASDVSHLPLLRAVAQTGKPVILSLGKCTLAEAEIAVETLFDAGCERLALLHCVAQYPAPIAEMNLSVIPALQHIYAECVIGLSDHSVGDTMGIAAVALGARVIEKHVTLSIDDEGPDHWFSLPIADFARYRKSLEDAFAALGGPRKRILTCEQGERRTSVRSLAAARAVAKGQPLTPADIKITRPGTGISPHLLEAVIGLRPSRDLTPNTVLTWELFK
jgi:sialic acid synthase SpsE